MAFTASIAVVLKFNMVVNGLISGLRHLFFISFTIVMINKYKQEIGESKYVQADIFKADLS